MKNLLREIWSVQARPPLLSKVQIRASMNSYSSMELWPRILRRRFGHASRRGAAKPTSTSTCSKSAYRHVQSPCRAQWKWISAKPAKQGRQLFPPLPETSLISDLPYFLAGRHEWWPEPEDARNVPCIASAYSADPILLKDLPPPPPRGRLNNHQSHC